MGLEAPATFSPLAAILAGRSTPELVYLQARFAAVMSFDLAGHLLGEVLPLGRGPARQRGPRPGHRGGPAVGG